MVGDALIVHSYQATLEASAFCGILLVPEDVHHCFNSLVSLFHRDSFGSAELSLEHEHSVQLVIPHSLLISLCLYIHLYKTWLAFTKEHSPFSYSSSTESG